MGISSSRYEVFISFRGANVGDNFLSHLFSALTRANIKTFVKDENLGRGEEITPSLLKIINKSRISVVIFSQDYPNSPWCLDELLKIYERKKKKKQIVIPLFYHVDPSDVQQFRGNYGSAFRNYNQDPRFTDKVSNWKIALKEISNLPGFHSDNVLYRPEAKLIEEVVKSISEILREEARKIAAAISVGAIGASASASASAGAGGGGGFC